MARTGDMIFRARRRKGWSQARLAAKIGKSAPQISNWENYKTTPNEDDLALLEKALGSSLKDTVIGDLIRDERSRKGYTQERLAEEIGKSAERISEWEEGDVKPKRKHLALLEEVFDYPLFDTAGEIDSYLDRGGSAADLAQEASVSQATIYNILSGKSLHPFKATVERIREALETLHERLGDKNAEQVDDDWVDEDEFDPEPPKFLVEGGLGKGGSTGRIIKSIRLFNPHADEQVESLPNTPGVYLFYAGDNDVAIPSDAIPSGGVSASINKLRLVGTPEYIGETRNIRERIEYWHKNHEKGLPRTWWFRNDWINLAVYVETDMEVRYELETLLIKLLSPQANRQKAGVKV